MDDRLAGVVWGARKDQPGENVLSSDGESGGDLTLLVRVRALAQQELDEPLAVLDAGRDHERRPAYLVLYAKVLFFSP